MSLGIVSRADTEGQLEESEFPLRAFKMDWGLMDWMGEAQ